MALALSASPWSRNAHAESSVPADVDATSANALDDEFDLELDYQPAGFPDPFERVNRSMLEFNRHADRWVLDPLTTTYRIVVPDVLRTAARRVFDNLGSLPVLVNDLFQLEGRAAGVTASRFVLNSTLGLGGLLDAGKNAGLEPHHADFGQSLALMGVGSGPYLVMPLLGPSNVRDGIGDFVDFMLHPMTILLAPAGWLTYQTGAGLARREALIDALNALDESSVDFYSALRNAYYQKRIADIYERREQSEAGDEDATGTAGSGGGPVRI